MLTVLCVLRSGGIYSPEWVRKLRDGVARNLTVPHRFACLSDVDVECERIPLRHNWPGWWSKIELAREDVVTGETLYLDLDTVLVANMDRLASLAMDFAMLRGFGRKHYVGSGVMWFRKPLTKVYETFLRSPEAFMAEYESNPTNRHNAFKAARGDQAFYFEVVGDRNIPRLQDSLPGLIQLYPKHFPNGTLPAGCAVVCFKGKVKPPDAMGHAWCREAWS